MRIRSESILSGSLGALLLELLPPDASEIDAVMEDSKMLFKITPDVYRIRYWSMGLKAGSWNVILVFAGLKIAVQKSTPFTNDNRSEMIAVQK